MESRWPACRRAGGPRCHAPVRAGGWGGRWCRREARGHVATARGRTDTRAREAERATAACPLTPPVRRVRRRGTGRYVGFLESLSRPLPSVNVQTHPRRHLSLRMSLRARPRQAAMCPTCMPIAIVYMSSLDVLSGRRCPRPGRVRVRPDRQDSGQASPLRVWPRSRSSTWYAFLALHSRPRSNVCHLLTWPQTSMCVSKHAHVHVHAQTCT